MTDIDEEEYKGPLDKLDDAMKKLGYIKVNYVLRKLLHETIERQRSMSFFDFKKLAPSFVEIKLPGCEEEESSWLHSRALEEWPDNELYDELVKKGIVKDEGERWIK